MDDMPTGGAPVDTGTPQDTGAAGGAGETCAMCGHAKHDAGVKCAECDCTAQEHEEAAAGEAPAAPAGGDQPPAGQ